LVEDVQEKKGHGKLSLVAKRFQKRTEDFFSNNIIGNWWISGPSI
jgi:hypothetical protein